MSESDRRYICTSCDSIVRARWMEAGSFAVGCDCTTVPVVPQMGQRETPDNWRVERPDCCRDFEADEMERVYGEVNIDYRCPECGAEYSWDGEMVIAPDKGENLSENQTRLVPDGGSKTAGGYQFAHHIDSHPIPFEPEAIETIWERHESKRDAPGVDEAHEEYTRTIAKWNDWHVFRPQYPFGHGGYIVFWNGAFGSGFIITDTEGQWHEFVNLFAEIVDAEGDCRDAEYSSSMMPSSAVEQRCENCRQWWTVG